MFLNKIDYWAKEKGMKHKHLARECGVTVQTFSRWVHNKTQPDLKQSFILARILQVEVGELGEFKGGQQDE